MRDPAAVKRIQRERAALGLDPLIRGEEPNEARLYEQAEEVRRQRITKGLIRLFAERPDWYDNAACKGSTALFFPNGAHVGRGGMGDMNAPGLAICATCPVKEPCRDAGRHGREFGIWGGESEYDRARLGILPHGARGKLSQLRRAGQAERDAENEAARERIEARRASPTG